MIEPETIAAFRKYQKGGPVFFHCGARENFWGRAGIKFRVIKPRVVENVSLFLSVLTRINKNEKHMNPDSADPPGAAGEVQGWSAGSARGCRVSAPPRPPPPRAARLATTSKSEVLILAVGP